jgi:hypothetical protein
MNASAGANRFRSTSHGSHAKTPGPDCYSVSPPVNANHQSAMPAKIDSPLKNAGAKLDPQK